MKIKSQLVLSELFSFIPKNQITNIILNNNYLNSKLETIKSIKTIFFKERIKNYEFNYLEEYLNTFKEDFNEIIKEEELCDFFYNSLFLINYYKTYYIILLL